MSSTKKLSEEIARGLRQALPELRQTLHNKLPLAIAAMLEAQTANTIELANHLPLAVERSDMREQWLRRLLCNELLRCNEVMEPFARRALRLAASHAQTIQLSLDQTDIGNRFAILMVSVRVGDRALPLTWHVEAGAANIGFAEQQVLLERVLAWLPSSASVMLSADRFYPSVGLIGWLQQQHWHYRVRLKSNFQVDLGIGEITTTGALAQGHPERYESDVMLFESAVLTNLGILHQAGHTEPWIIAMDARPTRAKVLDYASRWSIEPMFSDFKSRGFGLQQTQLTDPERLSRLLLIMALAMYWCVWTGYHDSLNHPTPIEKNPDNKPTLSTGAFAKPIAVPCHGLSAAYDC